MFNVIWITEIYKLIRPTGEDLYTYEYRKDGKRKVYKSAMTARREALGEIVANAVASAQEFALFIAGLYVAGRLLGIDS